MKRIALLSLLVTAPALANPADPHVVAGAATVSGEGTSTVSVSQSTDKAIIDWGSFSIGSGQSTYFNVPNASSVSLNRVTGVDPSLIYGTLSSNGRLILINPNGLVVGEGGSISANSFLATTSDITNENFLSGRYTFDIAAPEGSRIVNLGRITAADAGLVSLVAPSVENTGTITARLGTVSLGAATKFAIDLYGDGLISFPIGAQVSTPSTAPLLSVGGRVEGARVQLSARAARNVVNNVIGVSGDVVAQSAEVVGDRIVLRGQSPWDTHADGGPQQPEARTTGGSITVDGGENGAIMVAGSLDVSGPKAGTVSVKGERVHVTGTINASSDRSTGGTITIKGSKYASLDGLITANGTTGGSIFAASDGGFGLSGVLTARGASKGGSATFTIAGGSWESAGALVDVSGGSGGNIRSVVGGKLVSSAFYVAEGWLSRGGSIDVTAHDMFLLSSKFLAAGNTDGGRVRLGGEYQGGKSLTLDELLNAHTLAANDGVFIDVSSYGASGNGGTAIIWSDSRTTFLGSVDARGGYFNGTGGLIEVSSGEDLIYRGSVETARDGLRGGNLLLDPKNITIASGSSGLQLALDTNDQFGRVSLDGTGLAVGSFGDDGAGDACLDCGAVYLFSFADLSFNGGTLVGRIGHGYTGVRDVNLAGILDPGDLFGFSTSLSGNRLVVGATGDDGFGNTCFQCGAAYLFTFSDTLFSSGSLVGRIGAGYTGANSLDLTPYLDGSDNFGFGVSLDGNRVAVGASLDDGNGDTCLNCGAVYLLNFADAAFSGGVVTGRIGSGYVGANDVNIASYLGGADSFGVSVSLDGNRVAAGALHENAACFGCGAVYLFTFSNSLFGSGSLAARLGVGSSGPNDLNIPLGISDRFGYAVSLDGTRLAVGAQGDDGLTDNCFNCGAVYLYTFANSAFVGASQAGILGAGYSGAGSLDLTAYLLPNNIFGSAVSLDGNRLAVSAERDSGADTTCTLCGAAYLFTYNSPTFTGGSLAGRIGMGYGGSSSIDALFATNPSADQTIFASTLAAILNAGTSVTLQANNDITLATDLIVNNPSGNGGNLTLQAGRSIILNGSINTDNGNFTALANASGASAANREPGAASVTMAPGTAINAGFGSVRLTVGTGANPSTQRSGDISLYTVLARSIIAEVLGATGNVELNGQLNATGTGAAAVLASANGHFINISPLGANAITVPTTSYWMIYTPSTEGDIPNGLDGATRYNTPYDPANPFGFQTPFLNGKKGVFVYAGANRDVPPIDQLVDAPVTPQQPKGDPLPPTRPIVYSFMPIAGGSREITTTRSEDTTIGGYMFVPVSQRDRSQYTSEWADWAETCKATVYLIIARAAGDSDAVIDDFWQQPTGATTQGLPSGVTVGGAAPTNWSTIKDLVRSGTPVIINGSVNRKDGGPEPHSMLVTGIRNDGKVIAIDPWTGGTVVIDPESGRVVEPSTFPLKSFNANGAPGFEGTFQRVTMPPKG